jgi:anti-sigma-K factor RskA
MREGLHVLTGSYALDALTGPERDEFERHLHRCPSCAAEVRGLRETAARLAMAKAVRPPEAMQARVLDATYRTRQLPPLAGDRAPRNHRRTVTDLRWVRMPRLVAAVAAASVVVAIGLGITQADTQHQLQSARGSATAITRVVQAPDARLEKMRTTAGGIVTVVFSGHQRAAVITTTGMAPLPSGRVYQLWVMGPSGARSEGLLTQSGQTSHVLASDVVSGEQIGITVEPSGGTAKPTTTPVVAVPLTT